MMYNEKIANQTARRGGERMTIYNSQRPATAEEVYQDMCDRITKVIQHITFGRDIPLIYENIFGKSIPFGQMDTSPVV